MKQQKLAAIHGPEGFKHFYFDHHLHIGASKYFIIFNTFRVIPLAADGDFGGRKLAFTHQLN